MNRFVATALALCLAATPLTAEDMTREQMQELVLQTIRDNPEVVMEAIEALQAREAEAQADAAQAVLTANRAALENDPNAAVMGNPDGDVTIVEFFDYNCGYCRRVFGDVKALLAADSNIKLVMREWPILGDESVFAARASLASRAQGKYEEFHVALMEHKGRANEAGVMQVATDLGMDLDKLRADMDAPEVVAHIQTSQQLTQALGLNGTPAFIFGEQLVPGAIELEQMQALVEGLREEG